VSPIRYFAYGSNMETATFRGRRGIEFVGARPARATGWRLVLDKPPLVPIGEGFANIVPDPTAVVLGVLYEIGPADLEHLDLTEGVLIGNYRRIEIPVTALATPTTTVPAFTLVSEARAPELQPSQRYMACLIAGAEEHGLPTEYVAFLRSLPARPETSTARAFQPVVDQVLRRPQRRD
jgi:gamma-glutamylcyclotransferase